MHLGQRILVIGDGPSGLDLVTQLHEKAETLTLSINNKDSKSIRNGLPKRVELKGNIHHFTEHEAHFCDGTEQQYDVVFFATGNFPTTYTDY